MSSPGKLFEDDDVGEVKHQQDTPLRVYGRKRLALTEVQNCFDDHENKLSDKKIKVNVKSAMTAKKKKKDPENDENLLEVAEKINSSFKKVEDFQLHVE